MPSFPGLSTMIVNIHFRQLTTKGSSGSAPAFLGTQASELRSPGLRATDIRGLPHCCVASVRKLWPLRPRLGAGTLLSHSREMRIEPQGTAANPEPQ